MGKRVIDWTKGNAAIIAVINAIVMVCAFFGWLSGEQIDKILESGPKIAGLVAMVSGFIATVLPNVVSAFKKDAK